MAATVHTTNPVLEAHEIKVNGLRALTPNLDDASVVLTQAHAVLVLTNIAAADPDFQPSVDILRGAYAAVETLLEQGIREMIVGHHNLLTRRH